MKKIFLLSMLLLSASCYQMFDNMGCGYPSQSEHDTAKWFLNNSNSMIISNPTQQLKNLFGCYYQDGDEIYYYKSFWNGGYILVRDDKALISVEIR